MARVYKLPSGALVVESANDPRGYVPLPASATQHIESAAMQATPGATAMNPLQEQGVTSGERLTLQNFASSPQAIMSTLQKWGYDTKQLNRGFAVRKRGSTNQWKVLDPDTGIFGRDFINDVGDVLFDAVQGATVGATAIAGTVVGGAAVGAASEVARQGIGSALGIEDNFNAGQIGMQAAAGAAFPVVNALGAPLLKAGATAGGEAVATLAGIRKLPGLRDEAGRTLFASGSRLDTLIERAGLGPAKRELPDAVSVGDEILRRLKKVSDPRRLLNFSPEASQARKLLQRAEAQYGTTLDIRKHIQGIEGLTEKDAGETVVESRLRGETSRSVRATRSGESVGQNFTSRVGETTNRIKNSTTNFDTATDAAVRREGSTTTDTTTNSTFDSLRKVFKTRTAAQSPQAATRQAVRPATSEDAKGVLGRVVKYLADVQGIPPENVNLAHVPLTQAEGLKRILQNITDDLGHYNRTAGVNTDFVASSVKDAAHSLRLHIENVMDGLPAVGANRFNAYSELMSVAEQKVSAVHNLMHVIGYEPPKIHRDIAISGQGLAGLRKRAAWSTQARQNASNYVSTLFNDGSTSIQALRDLEALFPGGGLVAKGRAVAVSDASAGPGAHGVMSSLPGLSATGQFKGGESVTGALGIGGVGFFAAGGGLPGMAGAAVSLAAASPANIVRGARLGIQASRLAARIPNKAATARLVSVVALQQAAKAASAGTKANVSQTQASARKAYFTGR